MFDSLSDRIKADEQVASSERIIRWAVVAVISVLMFGGLYFGVSLLE
jgi:hypothetical protein